MTATAVAVVAKTCLMLSSNRAPCKIRERLAVMAFFNLPAQRDNYRAAAASPPRICLLLESPSGFPQARLLRLVPRRGIAAMPRLTTPCRLMSSKLTRFHLVSSRCESWALNAGFAFPSIQATGNSQALPARRPKGLPKTKPSFEKKSFKRGL